MAFLKKHQINKIVEMVLEAGKIAMSHFYDQNLAIKKKIDNSPVTDADVTISKFFDEILRKNFPIIPIICEEGENRDAGDGEFWLIDPIDGTKNFIERNDEFTINIALISGGRPVFGIIFAPAFHDSPLYYNNENDQIIKFLPHKNSQIILDNPNQKHKKEFDIIVSHGETEEHIIKYAKNYLSDLRLQNLSKIEVSSSLKFCFLLEQKANLYLHSKRSMEWDSAAGHALLRICGGEVKNFRSEELIYHKKDFINPPFMAEIMRN